MTEIREMFDEQDITCSMEGQLFLTAGPAIDPATWETTSEQVDTCIGCGRPAFEHNLRDCPEWY